MPASKRPPQRKTSRDKPHQAKSIAGKAAKSPAHHRVGQSNRADASIRREVKYYGVAACLALWQCRPHDIIRVYLEEALLPQFSDVLRWAAAKRKAYHIVGPDDLEHLTESIHHQGVCILARERSMLEFSDLQSLLKQQSGPQLLVYLDGVENPHNLGAIVRSCAHFGVRFILGAEGHLPKLSAAACRVAEGGAERVGLVRLRHPVKQLRELHQHGYQLAATAGGRGTSLYQHNFAAHSLLVMGAETQGVSASLFDAATKILKIPGTGQVESLNVSVAFALCAGEFYRQHLPR